MDVDHGKDDFLVDLKKKVGPLPVWGWGAISTVAGIGAIIIIRRRKAAAAAATAGDTTSSDGSTLGTPADATTAVGDSGEQSYYYGAVGPTTATPATTATQSQLAAATKLQTQIAQLESNAKAEGTYQGLIQSKVGGAAGQKTYAANKSKIDATITALNQQIMASINGVEVPSGTGTTPTTATS